MAKADGERTIRNAERDRDAANMRADGKTYEAIAVALGYSHRSAARRAVQRVLAATIREAGDELRVLELERLDRLYEAAMAVLTREHVTVSQGRVIREGKPVINDNGEAEILEGHGAPLVDDGPVLQAIDRLLKIQDRRAKLVGLDAPVKHEVRTIDAIAAEVADLERQLAERERAGRDAG
ncbi:hypothetical protein MXD63_14355 [Frankia sp. Cpl3]|nr:hypothetical protein [Frankia sp. Cpl3]